MVNRYYVYCRSGFELLGSLSFPGSRTVILVTPCLARRQKELVAQLTVRADKLAGQHIQMGNIVDHNRVKVLLWQSMMVVQSIPIVPLTVFVITNSVWSRGTYRNFREIILASYSWKVSLVPNTSANLSLLTLGFLFQLLYQRCYHTESCRINELFRLSLSVPSKRSCSLL
jgi:hypothetical protein